MLICSFSRAYLSSSRTVVPLSEMFLLSTFFFSSLLTSLYFVSRQKWHFTFSRGRNSIWNSRQKGAGRSAVNALRHARICARLIEGAITRRSLNLRCPVAVAQSLIYYYNLSAVMHRHAGKSNCPPSSPGNSQPTERTVRN